MKIELYHASKYGNGAMVADDLKRVMEARGHHVSVHHIDEVSAKALPPADLYVFGSGTRMGKPVGSMRRFVKKVDLPAGTKYALFATYIRETPDKKTGKMPTEEEMNRWRRTIPILSEILSSKGLVKAADEVIFVKEMKGPLEEGWQDRVAGLADAISSKS